MERQFIDKARLEEQLGKFWKHWTYESGPSWGGRKLRPAFKNRDDFLSATVAIIPVEQVEQRILLVRGRKVIIDADLAQFLGARSKNWTTITDSYWMIWTELRNQG